MIIHMRRNADELQIYMSKNTVFNDLWLFIFLTHLWNVYLSKPHTLLLFLVVVVVVVVVVLYTSVKAWWATLPKYCFFTCFTISMALFTVTSSFWLRPSSFLCHSFILRRSHLLPDQLPGEHTGLPSHVGSAPPLSAFRATHLLISHTHIW